MYGDTKDSSWYLQMIRDGKNVAEIVMVAVRPVSPWQFWLPGSNLAAAMTDGWKSAAAMAYVGTCSGYQGTGLFTLDEVRKHTKASASCGSCTGLVEQILASTIGVLCAAIIQSETLVRLPHSHEEVRKAIERKTDLHLANHVIPELEYRERVCKVQASAELLSAMRLAACSGR